MGKSSLFRIWEALARNSILKGDHGVVEQWGICIDTFAGTSIGILKILSGCTEGKKNGFRWQKRKNVSWQKYGGTNLKGLYRLLYSLAGLLKGGEAAATANFANSAFPEAL